MLKLNALKLLINAIEKKESHQGHAVLDAGKLIVLVLANNNWYLYRQNDIDRWSQLDEKLAKDYCSIYYHPNEYKRLVNLKERK